MPLPRGSHLPLRAQKHPLCNCPGRAHEWKMSERPALPKAYRSVDAAARGALSTSLPRNVFIEVTNRCNLRCETCPRTFATYETPRDLSLRV